MSWGGQGGHGHGQQGGGGWGQQGHGQQGGGGWGGQQQGGQQQGWGGQQQGGWGGQQQGGWGGQQQQGGWGGQQQGGQQQGGWGQQQQGLFDPNARYIIVSELDKNMALDISQDKSAKGTLILYQKHGGQNQQFTIRYQGGQYLFLNPYTGEALTDKDFSSNVVASKYKQGDKDQLWGIEPSSKFQGGYLIVGQNNKAFDVCEGKASNGSKIINYGKHGNKNQVFHFLKL